MRIARRLVLSVALLVVPACLRHAAEPPAVSFTPPRTPEERAAGSAAPVLASDVKVVGRDALPVGFHYDASSTPAMAVAGDYPSPSGPNRYLGTLVLKTSTLDDKYAPPAGEALAILQNEAAKRGANFLVLSSVRRNELPYSRGYQHEAYYHALRVESSPPQWPTVNEILDKLPTKDDGFKEVRRFTAKLEDLKSRNDERFTLQRGHAYRFAMAYHPEPIDLTGAEPIAFVYGHDESFQRGSFTHWVDRPRRKGFSSPDIDGIFTRGGGDDLSHDVFVKEEVTLGFGAALGPVPDARAKLAPGRGTADFVLYERALTPTELTDTSCRRCYDVAKSCSTRRELSACPTLQDCFKQIQMPLSGCDKAYEKL